ncbi:type VI secretion system-associated FHA domain protein TagH [Panacagrimonas sp.]|uniref:type VI secretion system-associated FHA domain protein TagH n=1 Tax=Panacagrimonas sp. TaxID=2480088 RepID=UPI003B52BDA1
MITVGIVRVEGRPPPAAQAVRFDELGGTIGRSADCTLVLTDDKRSVSRVHATVSHNGGQFLITDQGTNALRVNGNALGKGNSAAIKPGDQISIGPFELEVSSGAPQAPTVADSPLLGAASSTPSAGNNLFDDLLGGPAAGGGAQANDPFADLGFSPSAAPPSPPPSSSPPGGGLPDDFDLMAPPPASPDSELPLGSEISDDAFSGLHSSPDAPGSGSLDAMFGLSSGSPAEPFLDGPLGKPTGTPGSHDSGITQWLGSPRKATQDAVADDVAEINSPFIAPPSASPASPPPEPQAPPASAAPKATLPDVDLDDIFGLQAGAADTPAPASTGPTSPPAPPAAVDFDFDAPAPSRESSPQASPGDLLSSPPVPAPEPAPLSPAPVAAAPANPPVPTRSYERPPPPTPQAAAPPALPADRAELLEALLAGLDAQDLVIDTLTPELMYRIGKLMNESTAGTIALLNARGTVKREMRADVTMIASGRNNPLKFSPDARLALRYLFGPQMPGFMGAEEAMRDAYADLRAHEFGFMAGLRAALSGVLKRFDPTLLESRVPEKGGLGMLGGNRKAKLWDMFGELYRQLALEAEEDFHALFGREFLRAYEEHVAALERQRQKKGP